MKSSANRRHWLLASVGTVIGIAAWSAAGPINPPAGPVAPSYKTLSEVEPRTVVNATNTPGDANSVYRITAPGSYYLDQNLTCISGKHGVKIDAENVTLDLRGFSILGVTGSNDGINVPVGHANLTVRNGVIRGCPGSGIFAGSVVHGVYADLDLTYNALEGLWTGDRASIERVICIQDRTGIVAGSGCRIASCGSENNAQLGYTVGADCTFTSCTARGNQLSGFRATGGATLTACVSTLNNSHGFEFTQVRNSARDCGSYFNGGNGFVGSHSTRLEGCHADNNTQSGITLADYCSVRSCDATQNGSNGMNAGLYAQVLDCNSSLNAASGIVVTDGGVVRRCSASGNTGMGIAVFVGTTVEGCEVRSNTLDGIRAITSCYVLNNTADNNGGNAANGNQGGIRVEGVANRVEGNSLTGNDFSIYTSAATSQNNFFGRNTSRSPVQGHYQIVPGNSFGPIVAVSGVGDISTVNGAGYPMANFTY